MNEIGVKAAREDCYEVFIKNIILILGSLYEKIPEPIFFNKNKINEFIEDEELQLVQFCETLDFLNREGFINCSGYFTRRNSDGSPVLSLGQPVYLTMRGMAYLGKSIDSEDVNEKIGSNFLHTCKEFAKTGSKTILNAATVAAVQHLFNKYCS